MDYRRLPHFPCRLSRARRRHTAAQGHSEHAPSRHDRKTFVARRTPFFTPCMDSALAAHCHLSDPPTSSSAPPPDRQSPVPVVSCNRARAILPTPPNSSTGRMGRGSVCRPRILRPHCPKAIIKAIRPMGLRPQIKDQHPHQRKSFNHLLRWRLLVQVGARILRLHRPLQFFLARHCRMVPCRVLFRRGNRCTRGGHTMGGHTTNKRSYLFH